LIANPEISLWSWPRAPAAISSMITASSTIDAAAAVAPSTFVSSQPRSQHVERWPQPATTHYCWNGGNG